MKRELQDINIKLGNIDRQSQTEYKSQVDIFQGFSGLDTAHKRHLVNLIPPFKVDFQTGDMTLGINNALSKILTTKHKY